MAKLSPVFNDQTINANGDPAVGYKLFTYSAGSSTKQAVFTDAAGTIPHSNPIILNSLGYPTQGAIWIGNSLSMKFVLAPPTDTDPPTSPIKTIDNVQGVNDASVSISEWQASGVTPTYISASSFSLQGDQTTEFQKGRRAQFTTGSGTVYGKIINSSFAASITTVTMLMDGTSVLDSGLSVVNLSLLHATPSALPNPVELLRSSVVGNATLTPTWDYAYGEVQDVSGVITYTAIPNAPRPGATRIWYPAAGAVMTNGGNITVQGNANVTAATGDKWIINAITTTTFYVEVIKKSGKAAVSASDIQPISVAMASNAATITINATSLDFRSPTLSSGDISTKVISTPISTVISSGSTGGTINAVASRIIILAIDVPGVGVEVAWCNESGGINLNEEGVITTVAEGGAGAADSATVIYSTTARANVSYRVVGAFDSTQATAGAWATSPSLIVGAGGQALAAMSSLGYGQTPQPVARTFGAIYYSGGKPIMLNALGTGANNATARLTITFGGVLIAGSEAAATGGTSCVTSVIPPFTSYVISAAVGGFSGLTVIELK